MVDYGKVLKRKNNMCKKAISENTFNKKKNCIFLYEKAKSSINRNLPCKKNDIECFFNTCVLEDTSDNLYNKCINIMESISEDKSLLQISSSIFAKQIVPKTTDLDRVKLDIQNSLIPDNIKDTILLSIKETKICDRIISNDINISKKQNIGLYLKENKHVPVDNIINKYCLLIDSFKVPVYGKLNITLEQVAYNLQKYDIPYNENDMVTTVLEYYMLSNQNISDKDMEMFGKVLYEYNEYLIPTTNDIKTIHNLLLDFKLDTSKSIDKLQDVIHFIVNNKNIHDVSENLSYILELFQNLLLFTDYIRPDILQDLCYLLTYNDIDKKNIYYKDANKLLEEFQIAYNKLNRILPSSEEANSKLYMYLDNLKFCCNLIKEYINDCRYDVEKIEEEIKTLRLNSNVMTLNEFKIFKFHNLINAVIQTDKFVARKNLKIKKALEKNVSKIFDKSKKFFTESTADDIIKNISEDNYFELCLGIYEAKDSNCIQELNETFLNICKYMNNEFANQSHKMVYEYNDGIYKLYLKDTTYINLLESEIVLKESTMDDLDFSNSIFILDTAEKLEKFVNIDIDKIIPQIHSLIESKSLDKDIINETIKLLSYSGADSKYIINRECSNIYINEESIGNSVLLTQALNEANKIEETYIPFEVRLEAAILLESILNEEVNLNNIKLAIEGMKAKVKDLSSREQEFSRTLDATVNHFTQSIQNALTNDRREAIIKGSVIPSFSKCMKFAIVLAGVAVIANSVIPSVIVAFCALALSTKISVSERSLLLDEIDIELKALEKEIQMAEDSRNMKKYRTLLMYQKKLQRERQRIRYNLKTGQQLPDK